jgi:hypothetical protein
MTCVVIVVIMVIIVIIGGRGYTPGCFAKSVQAILFKRLTRGLFSRVWNRLIMQRLQVGLIRRDVCFWG